jgi:hypothetical protein
MRELHAERMAENEAVFRDANERIQSRARELDFPHTVPFLCECGDPACHEIVRLRLEAFESVRDEPTYFFVSPGHESVSGASGRVIESHDGFVVVEKIGVAGEVAEAHDRRG